MTKTIGLLFVIGTVCLLTLCPAKVRASQTAVGRIFNGVPGLIVSPDTLKQAFRDQWSDTATFSVVDIENFYGGDTSYYLVAYGVTAGSKMATSAVHLTMDGSGYLFIDGGSSIPMCCTTDCFSGGQMNCSTVQTCFCQSEGQCIKVIEPGAGGYLGTFY